jgi:hypothetical protein
MTYLKNYGYNVYRKISKQFIQVNMADKISEVTDSSSMQAVSHITSQDPFSFLNGKLKTDLIIFPKKLIKCHIQEVVPHIVTDLHQAITLLQEINISVDTTIALVTKLQNVINHALFLTKKQKRPSQERRLTPAYK